MSHQTVVRIEADADGAPLIAEVPPGERAKRLASQFVVVRERGKEARLVCLRCDKGIGVRAPRKELVAWIAMHEDCEVVAA